jgi:DNA-binding NtrC family response regulator
MNNPTVLLLDDNLMSATRVENQLRASGASVKLARQLPAEGEWTLVVLNLGSRSLNGLALVPDIQNRFPVAAIWGFAGHREVEIWRAAKTAGVTKMVSNEAAMSELGPLVRAFLGETQENE